MKVGIGITGKVIVDGKVDTLDIDTTAEDVGSDTDTLLEVLECLVALDTALTVSGGNTKNIVFSLPLLLTDTGVHCNRREVAVLQKFIKFGSSESALNEDDGLVELKLIEQLVKLSVLLLFIKFDVVLLKTVQSKLCLIINVDFKRILHELFANGPDFLGKSGAEHHHLLLRGSSSEDLLYITTHI